MLIVSFNGNKRIPLVKENFYIALDGTLTTDLDWVHEVDLFAFRSITGINVKDINVLKTITYRGLNIPPVYWEWLEALPMIEGVDTPESMTIAPTVSIESLECPGLYIIPNFSNYLISPHGLLYKRSNGEEIKASRGILGYYTYRMTNDAGHTQNQLRHRILCLTFKRYPANVDELDVNHIDGIPGNDNLSNLEWATRSENMIHAYDMGLRTDNRPVEILDTNTGRIYIYASCSQAAEAFKVTTATICNRTKTNGFKSFDGFQYRYYPSKDEWPVVESSGGKYLVEFPDGTTKSCGCIEAAALVGLTRTSLLRALREGRDSGTNANKVKRIE